MRPHDPEALNKVAVIHESTPIEFLTATGAQARAWRMLLDACATHGPYSEVVGALVAYYAELFDVDPDQVAASLPLRKR